MANSQKRHYATVTEWRRRVALDAAQGLALQLRVSQRAASLRLSLIAGAHHPAAAHLSIERCF